MVGLIQRDDGYSVDRYDTSSLLGGLELIGARCRGGLQLPDNGTGGCRSLATDKTTGQNAALQLHRRQLATTLRSVGARDQAACWRQQQGLVAEIKKERMIVGCLDALGRHRDIAGTRQRSWDTLISACEH
jgi:hypothetical protein